MKSPAGSTAVYRFGVFEFDAASGDLRKNGLKVRLKPQSAKLLAALLRSEGNLCTREELRRELWPADTFVAFEHSLNKAVWWLRQALGDFVGTPRYIETVSGQGYRFLVLPESSGNGFHATPKRGSYSVAVLPPFNASGSDEVAFFAGQLSCRLTNKLGRLPKLRVLASSVVKQSVSPGADPRAAGNQLGVDAVLTGEIAQRNGDILITLELIDSADGRHLWGTQLLREWPQAAQFVEQLADEILPQVKPYLARSRSGHAHATFAAETGKQIARIALPSLQRSLRPKKALLFA